MVAVAGMEFCCNEQTHVNKSYVCTIPFCMYHPAVRPIPLLKMEDGGGDGAQKTREEKMVERLFWYHISVLSLDVMLPNPLQVSTPSSLKLSTRGERPLLID